MKTYKVKVNDYSYTMQVEKELKHRDTYAHQYIYTGTSMANACPPRYKIDLYRVHNPWYYRLFNITPLLIYIN